MGLCPNCYSGWTRPPVTRCGRGRRARRQVPRDITGAAQGTVMTTMLTWPPRHSADPNVQSAMLVTRRPQKGNIMQAHRAPSRTSGIARPRCAGTSSLERSQVRQQSDLGFDQPQAMPGEQRVGIAATQSAKHGSCELSARRRVPAHQFSGRRSRCLNKICRIRRQAMVLIDDNLTILLMNAVE